MAKTRHITVQVTYPDDWNPERAQSFVQEMVQAAVDSVIGIQHMPSGHEVAVEQPMPTAEAPVVPEPETTVESGEVDASFPEIPRETKPVGDAPGSDADPQNLGSSTEVPAGGQPPRNPDHGKATAKEVAGGTAGGTPGKV